MRCRTPAAPVRDRSSCSARTLPNTSSRSRARVTATFSRRSPPERLNAILRTLGEQWEEQSAQLQKFMDGLRSGHAAMNDAPGDLPEHGAPFLRTVLDVACQGQAPTAADASRLRNVGTELVDLLVQELQGNRDIWSSHKRAAQENLS